MPGPAPCQIIFFKIPNPMAKLAGNWRQCLLMGSGSLLVIIVASLCIFSFPDSGPREDNILESSLFSILSRYDVSQEVVEKGTRLPSSRIEHDSIFRLNLKKEHSQSLLDNFLHGDTSFVSIKRNCSCVFVCTSREWQRLTSCLPTRSLFPIDR